MPVACEAKINTERTYNHGVKIGREGLATIFTVLLIFSE